MRLCFPLLLLFGAAAVADEPKVEAKAKAFSVEAKKELKKLEGKWKLIKIAGRGQETEMEMEVYFTFKEAKMTISTINGTKNREERTEVIALDPTTDPKCLDLQEKRPGKADLTQECVYKIDGDTLQLAISFPTSGKSRPPGFDKSTEGAMICTLKRVKE